MHFTWWISHIIVALCDSIIGESSNCFLASNDIWAPSHWWRIGIYTELLNNFPHVLVAIVLQCPSKCNQWVWTLVDYHEANASLQNWMKKCVSYPCLYLACCIHISGSFQISAHREEEATLHQRFLTISIPLVSSSPYPHPSSSAMMKRRGEAASEPVKRIK